MPLIFSKALHVTDITLDKPEIALLRDAAGKWNFSSLGSKSEPAAKPAASGPSSTPDLSVSKLDVKDGRLSVNRANSSIKPHVYDDVDISVRDFSPTSQFPFKITANLPAGGTRNWMARPDRSTRPTWRRAPSRRKSPSRDWT